MTSRLRLLLRYVLSCFLAFSLLLSVFAVNSFADSSIVYRLADFQLLDGADVPSIFESLEYRGKIRTKVAFVGKDAKISCFYKLSSYLKAGNSYTLTFDVIKGISSEGNILCQLALCDSYTNLDNSVDLGYFDTADFSPNTGQEYSIQVTYPENFNGKQCYIVVAMVNTYGNSTVYVSDFVFTNNNQTEEKIDGILEWLSAVYHSIVGGEDSRGVQHDGLVQGIKNGLSSLGDRISNFFDNLGEKFGIDIGSLGDRIRDFFSNFWENVSAGFDAIKDKIADIGEGIKLKFQEIADSFTAFFDTFKPRVYEEFLWVHGNINGNTGAFIPSPVGAYTSDVFFVPSGSKYVLDVLPSVDDYLFRRLRVVKYDVNGQFLEFRDFNITSDFFLESGFNYRFVLLLNKNISDLNSYDLSKLCNSFVKLYCDEGWVNALINAFMSGLKKLFIPGPGYFESKLDVFLETYEDHFGIFAQVTTYFIKAIQKVESILSDTYAFVFPELYITINGQKYVFSEQHVVDLQQWLSSGTWSANLYEMYRVCASAILVFCVLKYAHKVEGVILGNAETVLSEAL